MWVGWYWEYWEILSSNVDSNCCWLFSLQYQRVYSYSLPSVSPACSQGNLDYYLSISIHPLSIPILICYCFSRDPIIPPSKWSIMGAITLGGLFLGSASPIFLEMGAEMTFPVSEGSSASTYYKFFILYSISTIYIDIDIYFGKI